MRAWRAAELTGVKFRVWPTHVGGEMTWPRGLARRAQGSRAQVSCTCIRSDRRAPKRVEGIKERPASRDASKYSEHQDQDEAAGASLVAGRIRNHSGRSRNGEEIGSRSELTVINLRRAELPKSSSARGAASSARPTTKR